MEEAGYKDSKVTLAGEEWTVKYYRQVFHPRTHIYCKAARVPSKKEIWLSVDDGNGEKVLPEEVVLNFKRAILPMVVEDAEKKYGKDKVEQALKEMK